MATTTTSASARQGKRKVFAAETQQRIALNEQIAGISGAFGNAADLLPAVGELQQALLGGLVRSQKLEAERLAKRYGQDDERTRDAAARAVLFANLNDEVDSQTETIAHVVETFQQDGLFHGYVVRADATPAVAYTVRIDIFDATGQKRTQRASAKTDAAGYFRIDLGPTDQIGEVGKTTTTVQQFVDRVSSAMGESSELGVTAAAPDVARQRGAPAAAPSPGTTPTPTPAATSAALQSNVEVFDTTGRLVYEDPVPPTFEGVASELRYYAISDSKSPPRNTKASARRTW